MTPEGRFEFNRNRTGWWESYLGFLYSPFYFYGGYAIHGSGSVPAFPASHGCVRVEIEDMDYLVTKIRLGMPIYLYGDQDRTKRADSGLASRSGRRIREQRFQGDLDHGVEGLLPLERRGRLTGPDVVGDGQDRQGPGPLLGGYPVETGRLHLHCQHIHSLEHVPHLGLGL